LLGFGERFTAVDQRGRVVTTWADDRRVAGYGDSTYTPLPFFISSRGYSLALETDVRSTFDLAAERPDRYAWEAETGELSLVFSYGPTARDLVQQQVARTGLPPLPPIWAFGVWKTAIGGEAQVLRDAARLRQLGVPVSALYVFDTLDPESNIGWPYITFEGKRSGPYGALRALTDGLHAQGLKVLTYNTADFHLERPNYAFPAEQGFFLKTTSGQPYVHPGFQLSWLDFSNPQAVAWWRMLWKRSLVDLGFDGGMLDLGELTPPDARYANGLDGRAMHNRYPALYAQAAFEAVAALKPDSVLLDRSGAAGAQAFQHLQWPGDPLVDWSENNGFKSMLPAALSFGLSGFPYWHPEVGGYLADGLPRDSERELWFRWLELGAFSSLLRDQYGDHQTGSEPVEMWSDDDTIEAYRFYGRLHNSLVPYLYSYARIASETGLPLMRHLALNYPDDTRAWIEEREYTLGDELLVAPVDDEGARTRTLYLPAGRWVDFWSGAIFDGGREVTADAPLDRIPVYVRAGAIIPMAADFDTLVPAAEPGVRTWNGDLVIRVMPSNGPADSSFRLYDGTGLAYRTDGRGAVLSVRGSPAARGLEIHLPAEAPPAAVRIGDSTAAEWRYDAAKHEVVVSTHAADTTVSVEQ
jgi:alpha-D-xyloside xylohydrolase